VRFGHLPEVNILISDLALRGSGLVADQPFGRAVERKLLAFGAVLD
jgi:hypothetical protein